MLLFRNKSALTKIKQNYVLFLSFCRLFHCFQCSRNRKFNEISNERRDCEFCSLLFIFFIIFSNRASMTRRESLLTMFDC